MTERALLVAKRLRRELGTRTLWADIDLELEAGAALALRGPSGSGKSTLLRCLGGLEFPSSGDVTFDGRPVHSASASERRRLRRDRIGFVMQDHAVVPEWTVRQNLLVVRPQGVRRASLETRADDALLAVGLGGRGRQVAGLMSGGEQQRIAVARVLVQSPELVLADEPTASLDDASAERVRAGFDLLRDRGSAIVVATHDAVLAGWCDAHMTLGTAGE